jgi:hypothetical protein
MAQTWVRDYIRLAFRIDKAFQNVGDGPFVDSFYGPTDLRASVAQEPEKTADDLVVDVRALQDSLPSQGFEQQRASFLSRQVRAMEVFCRKLAGQDNVLQGEIQQCLDVRPVWKPDEDFEQALALLSEALPGGGDVRERFRVLQERTLLPSDRPELVLQLMHQLLAEARRRTQQFVELPAEEELEICTVREKPYGAANWYLGGYRSRLELNIDRPIHLFGLLYQMCHECYPGHHTEFTLKEKHLYRDCGYLEQSMFIMGPQLVISEGIASLAQEMIFTPDEIAHWITTQIYPQLGGEIDGVGLAKLIRAFASSALDDLGNNLVMMLWDGRPEKEIVAYALKYTPYPEDYVRPFLRSLKSPLRQVYAFTYAQGKRLMEPLLQGDDRTQVFRRLLTELVYPSLLAKWAGAKGGE